MANQRESVSVLSFTAFSQKQFIHYPALRFAPALKEDKNKVEVLDAEAPKGAEACVFVIKLKNLEQNNVDFAWCYCCLSRFCALLG